MDFWTFLNFEGENKKSVHEERKTNQTNSEKKKKKKRKGNQRYNKTKRAKENKNDSWRGDQEELRMANVKFHEDLFKKFFSLFS